MREAPNGDLYMIRNACSVTDVQTVSKSSSTNNTDFISGGSQTCPQGSEIPQLWMLPKNSGDAASAQAAWTLVAEAGSSGRTDMSGNTAANKCGDSPNKCIDNWGNTHISLLEMNGDYMYIAYDNNEYGLNIWRVDMSGVTSGTAPSESEFQLLSPGFGLGNSSEFTRIFWHLSYNDGGKDFLTIIAGNGVDPIKIFRTGND
ncbi:MAG: hypothetical protein GY756_18485 [bacterium]|nr:hypothetical protein [bacterium]